jgi:hypothetical protein
MRRKVRPRELREFRFHMVFNIFIEFGQTVLLNVDERMLRCKCGISVGNQSAPVFGTSRVKGPDCRNELLNNSVVKYAAKAIAPYYIFRLESMTGIGMTSHLMLSQGCLPSRNMTSEKVSKSEVHQPKDFVFLMRLLKT